MATPRRCGADSFELRRRRTPARLIGPNSPGEDTVMNQMRCDIYIYLLENPPRSVGKIVIWTSGPTDRRKVVMICSVGVP
jgi:hypothetical protein